MSPIMRTTVSGVARVRVATVPGTAGREWVTVSFVDGAKNVVAEFVARSDSSISPAVEFGEVVKAQYPRPLTVEELADRDQAIGLFRAFMEDGPGDGPSSRDSENDGVTFFDHVADDHVSPWECES